MGWKSSWAFNLPFSTNSNEKRLCSLSPALWQFKKFHFQQAISRLQTLFSFAFGENSLLLCSVDVFFESLRQKKRTQWSAVRDDGRLE